GGTLGVELRLDRGPLLLGQVEPREHRHRAVRAQAASAERGLAVLGALAMSTLRAVLASPRAVLRTVRGRALLDAVDEGRALLGRQRVVKRGERLRRGGDASLARARVGLRPLEVRDGVASDRGRELLRPGGVEPRLGRRALLQEALDR